MPHPDMLLESLERFASTLTGGYGVGDVLHDLTSEITDVLDLTGAGVTLVQGGKQRFVTAAVEAIAYLERVQENHQRGPCVDAVTTARPMTVSDLDGGNTGQRWPEYSKAAKTAGIRAVAGIPMLAEGTAVGAVNLYRKEPRIWPAEDLRVASVFANIATGYLVHASAAQQHQRTAEQLQQALSTRLTSNKPRVSSPPNAILTWTRRSCFCADMPATTEPASTTLPAPSSTATFTSPRGERRTVAARFLWRGGGAGVNRDRQGSRPSSPRPRRSEPPGGVRRRRPPRRRATGAGQREQVHHAPRQRPAPAPRRAFMIRYASPLSTWPRTRLVERAPRGWRRISHGQKTTSSCRVPRK